MVAYLVWMIMHKIYDSMRHLAKLYEFMMKMGTLLHTKLTYNEVTHNLKKL